MNFDEISESVIPINIKNNDDNLIEYFKLITLKIIWTCESTLFKITFDNDISDNLLNDSSNYLLADYLKIIFSNITNIGFNTDIDLIIDKINKYYDNDRNIILNKVFYLIDEFYKNIDREDLVNTNYETYKQSIETAFSDFIITKSIELIHLVKNKEFSINSNFQLSLN